MLRIVRDGGHSPRKRAHRPERLVSDNDWPHPTMPNDGKPDDALLFGLLSEWAPEAAPRERILVRNPETLYGFRS